MTKKLLITLALLAGATLAQAKIPAPVLDDAAKAKAAETAAKTAWSGKVDAYLLCKSQDKVAAAYYKNAKAQGKETKPPTPAPACADPGPFAYSPPSDKPLEAAGAHSPATNATSPPSSKTPAAAMAPAKK